MIDGIPAAGPNRFFTGHSWSFNGNNVNPGLINHGHCNQNCQAKVIQGHPGRVVYIIGLPSGYDIHSLPWKDPLIFKFGKPSISMDHGFQFANCFYVYQAGYLRLDKRLVP